MELNIKEPKDMQQLREITKEMEGVPNNISVIIENNIFSVDGKWLLRNTEGSLENIQALVDDNDETTNFRTEVRKTTENFKGRMDIDIKKLLYARLDIPKSAQEDYYLVLSYLSVLETGNQEDIDKWEKNGFVWKNIKDIDRQQLTPNTSYTYGVIRQNESEIGNLLNKYKKFDNKNFEKYFLHGINNRDALLEGIMYYTNSDLTNKYLDLEEGEKFPTTEEKLKSLEQETVKNYRQIYRFLYLLDEENKRFDYHLTTEEKEQTNKMAKDMLQGLLKQGILLCFRRGIFFNDRINGNKSLTYDKIKKYEWTKEVYKVIKGLQFMEFINPNEYYKNWLKAKISRLKQKKECSEEKINQLEEICNKFFNDKIKEKIEGEQLG